MYGNIQEMVINNTYIWFDMEYPWYYSIASIGGSYFHYEGDELFLMGTEGNSSGFRCVRTLQSSSE